MPSQYNVALVGAGGIAGAHRQAADSTQGRVRVVAAVDTRQDAPAAAGLPMYADVESLLASEHRPDGIILCTPPSVREAVIAPALESGLAILCEKPVARTHDEAQSLLHVVAKHDAADRAFVGYCHRFTPAVLEMRRRLLAGDLGTPIRLENTFACWHPTMKAGWMSDRAVSGGGSFLDTGCHSLDLFRFVTDEKAGGGNVVGSTLHHEWPGRGDSDATVLLRGGKGIAGVIQSGWQEPERFIVTLVGTHALLSYDYMVPDVLRLQTSDPAFGPSEDLPVMSHDVRFARQLEAFARRSRGEAAEEGDQHLCTFAEAAEVARLVDQAMAGDS